MSQAFPLIDGFVGYGDGLEAQLRTDEPWDAEHPLRVARPELFTEPEQVPAAPAPAAARAARKAKAAPNA